MKGLPAQQIHLDMKELVLETMLLHKQQFTDGQLHLTAVAFDDIDDFD